MDSQQIKRQQRIITSAKPPMGISTRIVGLLNILSLLCSLPFLCMGIWLATRHGTECLRFLQWPIIAVGLFMLLFSLAGLIGSCFRVRIVLGVYLAVTLLIIVLLLAITAFTFIVTSHGSGESVRGHEFQEYHLDKYSKWMRHEVSNSKNWKKIKKCIQDAKVCQKLSYNDSHSFVNADLSPLQSGCCKPPIACNLTIVNATDWIPTAGANSDNEADCNIWNNNPSELCYECDSCRAGVAENIRHDWGKMALACMVLLIFLIAIYSLGCCALRNSRYRYYEISRSYATTK